MFREKGEVSVRKKRLWIFFTIAVILSVNMRGASAHLSPYIAVIPQCTLDETLTPGENITVSIYTDYNGSDVWGYEFTLTYNPLVLNGISVTNGDLIVEGTAVFIPKPFDNQLGYLDLTGAFFFFMPPNPAPFTSGPGTLANITFTVVGYGSSEINFGPETRLITYTDDGYGDQDNIIDNTMPGHIQDGFFSNKILGDVNGDRTVDASDLFALSQAYESDPSNSTWNPDCDLNWDGTVDISDLSDLSENYGRSI